MVRGHAWQWDMCGGGHAWWGCVWYGGICVAGGMGSRRGACMVGGMHGRRACMAEETATAADGAHPTGMHSC